EEGTNKAGTNKAPADASQAGWVSGTCDPVPEPDRAASFSDLAFSGECAFHQTGPAQCHGREDDFYLVAHRDLEGARQLTLYVNVERYSGPGVYENDAQVHVMIKDGESLYRWSAFRTSVSLGANPGGLSVSGLSHASSTVTVVTLPTVDLAAEP